MTPALAVGAVALVACLCLGGATRSGFLADFLLQLISVPLLLVIIRTWRSPDATPAGREQIGIALAFAAVLVLLPVLQLVPLPPLIWENLPGREAVAATYALLERELPWRPLSVTPRATWLALLSLLPSLVVFLAALQMGHAERRIVGLLIVGVAIACVFLGLMQLAQGPNSRLRMFPQTNTMDAVGFFANRNHFSALLYSAFLLCVPWVLETGRELKAALDAKKYPTRTIALAVVGFTCVAVLIAGQATSRSRAGIGLAVLAVVCAMALPVTAEAGARAVNGTRALLLIVLVAAVSFMQLANFRAIERLDTDLSSDARIPIAHNTTRAALDYFPFGAGVGSFVSVYDAYESNTEVHDTYANRAHNDFLEAGLETGIVGLIGLFVFAAWLVSRTIAAFGAATAAMDRHDRMVMRAAALVVVLLLIHSFVDYPLRTGAMGAVFAFCCALLVPPPQRAVRTPASVVSEPPPRRRSRSKSRAAPAMARPGPPPVPPVLDPNWGVPPRAAPPAYPAGPPPLPPAAMPIGGGANPAPVSPSDPAHTWGSEVEWPTEWRAQGAPAAQPASALRSRSRTDGNNS